MTMSRATQDPPLSLGLTSVLLGAVALLLAGLPILAIPLGGVGLLFGLGGLLADLLRGRRTLRWSVGGTVLSALALTLSVAINEAPEGYLPARRIPLDTQPVPVRPYISPPARPVSRTNETGDVDRRVRATTNRPASGPFRSTGRRPDCRAVAALSARCCY